MEVDGVVCWSRAGLCNRLHAVVNAVYLREMTGRRVYTCWPINEHLRCEVGELFDEFPVEVMGEAEAREVQVQYGGGGVCVSLVTTMRGRQVSVRSPLVLAEIPSSYVRQVLRGLKWKREIVEAVEREWVRMGFGDGRQVLGIHARGKDITNRLELIRKIEEVLRFEKGGDRRFLLCSDEVGLVDERDKVTLLSSSHHRLSSAGIRDSVIHLLLLSKTTLLYYSPMSTFSWVAIALSNADIALLPRRQVKGVLKRLPISPLLPQNSRG